MIAKEDLQNKADRMNQFLQEVPSDAPDVIIERINFLSVLISQSGECLAAAEYYRDAVISSETMRVIKDGYVDKVSMTVINNLIKSLAKKENFLVKTFDRINSASAKQMAGLITILSYKKTEFSSLNYTR